MTDALILAMYLMVVVRPALLVAVAPLLISVLLPGFLFTSGVIVTTFCALSLTYAASAIIAAHMKQLASAFALLFMAVYLLVFSFDSWINSNVETWIYANHEVIILSLHIFIILSFSKRFGSFVDIGHGYCCRNMRTYSDLFAHYVHSKRRVTKKKAAK